jgi:hypothetical protein
MRVRLPHPELSEIVRIVESRVTSTQHAVIAGLEIRYAVFRSDAETEWSAAYYDEAGNIFVAEDLVALNQNYADLTAFHEYLEIGYKRAGRSHAYAHRRAFVEELLAARDHFGEPAALRGYLRWRIEGYPQSKVPATEPVIKQFERILSQRRPLKGELLEVIKQHRL